MTLTSPGRAPWPMSTVGAHFEIQLGKMLDSARSVGQPKPYVGNRAVQWGRIDLSAAGTVPLTKADQARYRLRRNDLLVCEGGEVGRAAIWQEQLPECYYQKALHRLRPKLGFDSRVMMALLRYWSEIGKFRNFVTQTSIAHLPRDKFLTMPLPEIPPKEQKCIAEILKDTEGLGSSLRELIWKKGEIRKALLEQLLGGKLRLPGYDEEWRAVKFGKLASPVRERIDPRRADSNALLIELESIESGRGRLVGRSTAGYAVSLKTVFREGDVLFGKLRAYLRKFWLADTDGLCSTEVWALRPTSLAESSYLRYLVETDRFIEVASGGYGTHMPRADWGMLSDLPVEVPPVEEQRAIAAVLHKADLEIEALRSRLAKIDALFVGMTQQMVSGRVRLAATEAVAA